MKGLKTVLLFVTLSLGTTAYAGASPVPMLENVANQIIATLKQNKASLQTNKQIIHQAVERSLLPNVDVSGMSRSVLGRKVWGAATSAEKQQFSRAFTQLVIRTYATPLAQYSDETIKFLPVRGSLDSRFIRVNSLILRSNGKDIPLTYSLVKKNDQWKIYDLSVEGVSLLQSFRSQFAGALRSSSMQDLIKEMNQRGQKAA